MSRVNAGPRTVHWSNALSAAPCAFERRITCAPKGGGGLACGLGRATRRRFVFRCASRIDAAISGPLSQLARSDAAQHRRTGAPDAGLGALELRGDPLLSVLNLSIASHSDTSIETLALPVGATPSSRSAAARSDRRGALRHRRCARPRHGRSIVRPADLSIGRGLQSGVPHP